MNLSKRPEGLTPEENAEWDAYEQHKAKIENHARAAMAQRAAQLRNKALSRNGGTR